MSSPEAMTRGALTVVCMLLSPGIGVSSALAFSDPERFVTPTEEGGGGERFFTGSPADGYTCVVCHRGGASPEVVIRGLPMSGYDAGERFEVELAFASGRDNHAVALEMVDAEGRDLGLELLADDQIKSAERCGARSDGRRASYLAELGERRVVGVEACEANAVRFRFRAPKGDRAMFIASVLASDNSATVDGDGVTEIVQPLYRSGTPASTGGCSAGAAGEGACSGWSLLLAALAALRTRKLRRKR